MTLVLPIIITLCHLIPTIIIMFIIMFPLLHILPLPLHPLLPECIQVTCLVLEVTIQLLITNCTKDRVVEV